MKDRLGCMEHVEAIRARHDDPMCLVLDPQVQEDMRDLLSILGAMAQRLFEYEVALLREARRPH